MSNLVIQRRFKAARDEASLSNFIPYSAQIAPYAVIGRNGSFFATWRLTGIPFETADDESLEIKSQALNLLYRSLPDNSEITVHRIRRPFFDSLSSPSEPGFARDFSLRYNHHFRRSPLMRTELYFTIELESGATSRTKRSEATEMELLDALKSFDAVTTSIERSLAPYSPVRLRDREEGGVYFSEQLEFFNFLLTGVWAPVRIPDAPLSEVLGNAHVFFSRDLGEITGPFSHTFFQSVEIKDFPQATESGVLDGLLYTGLTPGLSPYPFVETQQMKVLGKAESEKFLKRQQSQLIAASDSGSSQIAAISDALDALQDGHFTIGDYSYTLTVFGSSEVSTRRAAQDAAEKMKEAGFLPYISTLALPGAYFAMLPGNSKYSPRVARLTSLNFAHLAAFHSLEAGRRDGTPWGEALLAMRTPASEPYYFSFHAVAGKGDQTGQKALGNSIVIGASGTGKTAFLSTCAAFAQKYRTDQTPLSLIFFDKDCGAETTIASLPESVYFKVEKGIPTGWNPFALPPTPENRQFLRSLVTVLITSDGRPLSALESKNLNRAVDAVLSLDPKLRRLAALPQTLTAGRSRSEQENALSIRLSRWIGNGDLAWIFDNPADSLDFSSYKNFGLDGTAFLSDATICPPIAMYLLYKLNQALDGRRSVVMMDEFWMWLRSPVFADFALDQLKTIRKKNGVVVFATQSPADVLKSPIAKDVIEQSATQIFLPNPRASEEDYVAGFKATPEEFLLIKSLGETSRQMLIRQGGRTAVAQLDLSPFPADLAVLSASAGTIETFEQVREAARKKAGISPGAPVPSDLVLPEFFRALEIRSPEIPGENA